MIVYVIVGILLLVGVGAGLAQRRAKAIQSSPNFAPTDHVEVDRFGAGMSKGYLPTETHHDQDGSDFQMGD